MLLRRHASALGATGTLIALLSAIAVGCAGGGDDKSAIAFTLSRGGFAEIWLMDADGGNRRRLSDPRPPGAQAGGSSNPAWSPDGESIAYSSSGAATGEEYWREVEIYVMRADGSKRRRLTHNRWFEALPSWSPDGSQIAFVLGAQKITVIDADGRNRVSITRASRRMQDSQPAWSPDGRVIAFNRVTAGPDGALVDIYAVEPSGARARLLISDGFDPVWSPDGKQLLFTSLRDRNGETCYHECSPSAEIYLADADGSAQRRLTRSEADDRLPTWSPDGTRIAFVSDRSDRRGHQEEIYVMAPDGSSLQRLTRNNVGESEPDWRPADD